MRPTTSANPFGFTALGTGFCITIVYIATFIPLLWTQEVVPSAPSPTDIASEYGLNITQAWLDLSYISGGYHPYNSKNNDDVRRYLLARIEDILAKSNRNLSVAHIPTTHSTQPSLIQKYTFRNNSGTHHDAVIFDDLQSSLSFSSVGGIGVSGRLPGISVYFQGTNLMVYIRGSGDVEGDWWNTDRVDVKQHHNKGGVLVNAHYDSVSTGHGATDDGVGVVTVLQLIDYFTQPGKQPKKGIVALLNNGEEDFLNGARAYTQHPISNFAYTFLNLEGAGAGGRAILFRSTDAEVTEAYANSPYPFGTVIAADAFKLGAIRSQTDYVVLEDTLGLRGLDLAFWSPRSRYHTDQDDARHTSVNSLMHMLSTSIATVTSLSSDTSDTFDGPRADRADNKVKNGAPSDGVWFDLFGQIFLVFHLRALFAWSLALAIASPLILLLICYVLSGLGKFYYFSSHPPAQGTGERLSLHGWRGFFRFPIAFALSSALTFGSAFLVTKLNPLIVYSSLYAVWTMMLTLFFCSFWFIMKGADFTRPSALHRGYTFFWLFLIGWVVLVASTVFEDRFRVASGYIFVFYESLIFLATCINLLDSSSLPSKDAYGRYMTHAQAERDTLDSIHGDPTLSATPENDEEDPTEQTSLLGETSTNPAKRSGFANYTNPDDVNHRSHAHDEHFPEHELHGNEQAWSAKMPQWTWLLQFLLLGPIMIIVIGQVALVLVTAVSQTGADGSSLLVPYILMAFFTILLLIPIGPFAHRISYHVPTFLFFIFVGTLAYSLLAFPFSAQNRYKVYFQQSIDLETGDSIVTLAGLEDYVRPIIATLPSASGQDIVCEARPTKIGLQFCTYTGLTPAVTRPMVSAGVLAADEYRGWLDYNITKRSSDVTAATFSLSGANTRACVIRFDKPIRDFSVHSKSTSEDARFPKVSEGGSSEIRLWHRKWDDTWKVDVQWPKDTQESDMTGSVVCLWSDANTEGLIPALDELRRYAPVWSTVSKLGDGLVEGVKAFAV